MIDGEYSTQGWNRFSYVKNNPVRYKDPSGNSQKDAEHDAMASARIVSERYIINSNKGSVNNLPDNFEEMRDMQTALNLETKNNVSEKRSKDNLENILDSDKSDKNPISPSSNTKGVVVITSGSPFYNSGNPHPGKGIDILGTKNDEIISPENGTINRTFVGKKGVPGASYIEVVSDTTGFTARYKHTINSDLKKGDKIKKGDKVGMLDDSGNWEGWHLHYEVEDKEKKPVDPVIYLNKIQPNLNFKLINPKTREMYESKNQEAYKIIKENEIE